MRALFFVIVLAVISITALSYFYFFRGENNVLTQTAAPVVEPDRTFKTESQLFEAPKFPAKLPEGFKIGVFAKGLDTPRDLEFTPGGTLLVSDPGSSHIVALPDKDKNGVADDTKVIVSGGNNPHGLAFHNGKLFVAETTQVVRYFWSENLLEAKREKVLFSLPSNGNHNKRTIVFDKAGKMYVSVGSTCNVCSETEDFSATIIVSDSEGKDPRVYAKGLRNAPFMQFNPQTADLWVTEMGRDLLGDNIPPDEIDIIKEGKDYGWPICYGNRIHDTNFDKKTYVRSPCLDTEAPIYEIPAHSAPLGLVFVSSKQFPADLQGDLLVAYHGSWNRSSPTGYKVVRLNVEGSKVTGSEDFLTGFIPESAKSGSDAIGRPVDLIFDKEGSLFISDDKAGAIYKVTKH